MGKEENKPKNWSKKTPGQLKKMSQQERARHMAYEETPKEIQEKVDLTLKRVKENKAQMRKNNPVHSLTDDREKHKNLIGQLKAAEARNRIRVMRLQYQAMKGHEIKHLIACQPTSLKALRFEALVPPYIDNENPGDTLDKSERTRIESILEDELGLTINRKLD